VPRALGEDHVDLAPQLVQRRHRLQVVAFAEHIVCSVALIEGAVLRDVTRDTRPHSAAEAIGIALTREADPDAVFLMRLDERDQLLAGEVAQRHVLTTGYSVTRLRLSSSFRHWAAHLADLMAEARAERYARERAALDHLHATELHLAAVELQASTPDWSDPFWHEEQWAALDTVASELGVESRRLVRLERRTAARAHPDPRVLADLRSTRARVRCWQTTMQRQRATLLDLPRTPTEADEAVAAARAKVAAARASTGLTDDEHPYLASPVLAAVVERSRAHPEERVGRPARA